MSDYTKPIKKISYINVIGLQTLIKKEVSRFLNVYTQTIMAPIITTVLLYAVFALAFGGIKREVGGVSYMEFLAPGLLMMTMVQNAFANTSSSLVISKVQGNIVDVLMPPLSASEIFVGYIAGGVSRGLIVGLTTGIVMMFFVGLPFHAPVFIALFAVLGTMMLSTLGILGGLWSEKFDHIAAFTNFFVTPLTFLSGTFYSIQQLPPFWQNLAHYNPFFFMIDGFRFGFIGVSDNPVLVSLFGLIAINVILCTLALRLLKSGYKIKS